MWNSWRGIICTEAVNEHKAMEDEECERIKDTQATEASLLRIFFPFKLRIVLKYLSKGRKNRLNPGKK